MSSHITNVLSIDLEDYYMVSAFESVVRRKDWDRYESRIERNSRIILKILSESESNTPQYENRNTAFCTQHPVSGVKATFFCLAWIAEKYPALIKEIASHGHEIASHGCDHRLVYHMTPDQFRADVRKSKKILEDITGKEVIGYRAPSYSITEKSLWALRILAEEGYRYDSSIFPIYHDRYGIPAAPRYPFVIGPNNGWDLSSAELLNVHDMNFKKKFGPSPNCDVIIEFPISTTSIIGVNAPVSGGGYFRLLPYAVIKRALRKINKQEGTPFIIYLHPWEIDPGQPRLSNISMLSKFRHYINLGKTASKLRTLLSDFSFSTVRGTLNI